MVPLRWLTGHVWVAGQMALVLQGALLVRHAPAALADAFGASRPAYRCSGRFGTLPKGVDYDAIIARAMGR